MGKRGAPREGLEVESPRMGSGGGAPGCRRSFQKLLKIKKNLELNDNLIEILLFFIFQILSNFSRKSREI